MVISATSGAERHKFSGAALFGGLSVEETSEILEISPKTVKRD
jgi:hypothetical protein